ncbi:MAG: IPExxxVDY family protein [Bacteroidota bacterium]
MKDYNGHPLKRKQLLTPYPLEDVTVLGITSVQKAYKLSWLINQVASLRLAQAADWRLDTPSQATKYIVHFLSETENCTFRLVKNGMLSHEDAIVGYLIPRLKQFDFFFTVQDFTQTFQADVFCDALKATKQITYVAHLPAERWHQTDLLSLLGCC